MGSRSTVAGQRGEAGVAGNADGSLARRWFSGAIVTDSPLRSPFPPSTTLRCFSVIRPPRTEARRRGPLRSRQAILGCRVKSCLTELPGQSASPVPDEMRFVVLKRGHAEGVELGRRREQSGLASTAYDPNCDRPLSLR
jgi:hypothetical protein